MDIMENKSTIKNHHYKLIIFITYFVQGCVSYLIFFILSLYLNVTIDLDPVIIGLYAGATFIPYTLKIFIGPLMDKIKIPIIGGRLKPYIIIGGVINAIFLIPLGLDPTSFLIIYFFCWMIQNIGYVFLDVAVDILIINDKRNRNTTTSSIISILGLTLGQTLIGILSTTPLFDKYMFYGFFMVGMISLTVVFFGFFFKEKEECQDLLQALFKK
ncbi:MAG: hypothetical protein GF329_03190 [Candidatus Lokiarchaeota archaeon]|nr:hypothetical protein [Candidatus Lokiarchaeota archaeon]